MRGKRFISLLLVIAMMLSLGVTAWADDDPADDPDTTDPITTENEEEKQRQQQAEEEEKQRQQQAEEEAARKAAEEEAARQAAEEAARRAQEAAEREAARKAAEEEAARRAEEIAREEEARKAAEEEAARKAEEEERQRLAALTIFLTDVVVSAGDSEKISASVLGGSAGDVSRWEWASSDSGIAAVSGSGSSATIRGVSAGTARVGVIAYASDGSIIDADECTVTVSAVYSPITVTGGTRLTIKAGSSERVSASISGGSGSYEYDWTYEGESALRDSMRQNAEIYGMDAGTGSVTLTVYDGEDRSNYDSTTWNVTVQSTATPLTATLRPSSLTLSVGDTGTLTVSASGGSGNNSNYTYNWYSLSNKVSVSGNGTSATVTAVGIGSSTVSVDVYDGVTGTVKTVEAAVTVQGGSASYNASGSATVGSSYSLSAIAGNIASEFRNRFGKAVSGSAAMQFSSPSSSVGVLRAQNGNQIRANESISYNSLQAVYFQANSSGTFSTGYSLTDGGNTISGTLSISASGGAAVTGFTLSSSSMDMATYSSRYLSVNVSPSNAAYSVSWSSSNDSIAYVSGSGSSVTVVSQGRVGSAVITASVRGQNGGSYSRSCSVYVSSASTYNPTLTVTLGSDYYGTTTSESMAKQFRNVYGYNLNNSDATIRFSSTGNSRYGVMRLADGSQIRSDRNYTFAEWINMYFEPLAAGTFSLPYTLSYRGDVLSGTLDIYIRSANVNVTISQSALTMATYSNQAISVSVTPANVYYTVSWRSTNTSVATVTGSGVSATIKSTGATGTATIYATVTDRNGVEVYRSCTVTVSNKNNSFSPSVSTTIGVPYTGTGTSDAMKAQFRSLYGVTLPDSATIRFSSTGNNAVATLRLKNGAAVKANTDYTMAEYVNMYTDPVSAGIFSIPYTLTHNAGTLSGNVQVNVNLASVNAALELKSTQPYTFFNAASDGATGSSLLGSAITNGLGSSWSYVRFGSSTSSVGTLYRDSSRTQVSASNIGQSELGNLYFVPAGASGDYSIPFAVYNNAGNSLANGTLYIRVSAAGTAQNGISFGDVKESDWFGLPVQWAVGRGITNGMSVDKATGRPRFEPNTTCNNAQIITFLWRSQGSPLPMIANPYSDVKTTDYFYNAAVWAYEKGLTGGRTFGEKTDCTRAMAVTYMWKLAGRPGSQASSFSDVPRGTDEAAAADWAMARNIAGGIGNDANGNPMFGPDMTCTRGHISTFLYRAYA